MPLCAAPYPQNYITVDTFAHLPVVAQRYAGLMAYTADTGAVQVWNGSAWVAVGSGGGGGGSSTLAGDTDVSIAAPADWDILRRAGAVWVNDQLTDNPAFISQSTTLSTLQSQVAALSTQSTLVARRGTNTAITNSTNVNSDLMPADVNTPFVGDSALLYFGRWELINTSGAALQWSILSKINGTNSLNPPNFTLGNAAAGSSYILDITFVLTAGATNLAHSQFMIFTVRPAIVRNSNSTFAYGLYTDPSTFNASTNPAGGQTLDAHGMVQSTNFDIGTTRPTLELRVNCTTAPASGGSTQRIVSEEYQVIDH